MNIVSIFTPQKIQLESSKMETKIDQRWKSLHPAYQISEKSYFELSLYLGSCLMKHSERGALISWYKLIHLEDAVLSVLAINATIYPSLLTSTRSIIKLDWWPRFLVSDLKSEQHLWRF